MIALLLSLLRSFRVYFQSRADLQTEILALRHQIVVLQRHTPKPKLNPADRRFWVVLSQLWSRWRTVQKLNSCGVAVVVVQQSANPLALS
jgi:hypothetical protein